MLDGFSVGVDMTLNWNGDKLKKRMRRAQLDAVNTTMAAAVILAKQNHGPGAHGAGRFETQTGSLERSIRIMDLRYIPARKGVIGLWGSADTNYARRIEIGFQGKDKLGRVVDAPAFPFLIPAAQIEYPKLAGRIRRAFKSNR